MPDHETLMNLPAPSQGQVIAELARELDMRESVYRSMVYNKTLKPHEAKHRKDCMRRALADLRAYYYGQAEQGR